MSAASTTPIPVAGGNEWIPVGTAGPSGWLNSQLTRVISGVKYTLWAKPAGADPVVFFGGAGASLGGAEVAGEAGAETAGETQVAKNTGGSVAGGLAGDAAVLGIGVALEQWVIGNVSKALTYVVLFIVGAGMVVYGAQGLARGGARA